MNDSLDVTARYIAAGSPEASVRDLEIWAEDESSSVRRRVAENSRTPLHCLIKLANDSNTDVKIAVSENQYTPLWLLEELSSNEDLDLRYSMAENSNIPRTILADLSEDENPFVAHRARRTLKRMTPGEVKHIASFEKIADTLEHVWQVKIC